MMISPSSQVKPCCRFDSSKYSKDFIWNGKSDIQIFYEQSPFDEIRRKMNSGEPIEGCHRCYKDEKLGIASMRQKVYPTKLPKEIPEKPVVTFLELAVGRVCNLKCRSCNAFFSTKWDNDAKKLGEQVLQDIENINLDLITNEFLKQVNCMKISGGEPFLHPQFNRFLNRLKESGLSRQINMEIFTNGSLKPQEKTIQALKTFNSMTVMISVDAIDKKNYYLRHPSNWTYFTEVVNFWCNNSNQRKIINVNFAITVSIYNIISIFELLEWIFNITNSPETNIIFQIVHDPEYMSVPLFPEKIRRNLHTVFLKKWAHLESHFNIPPILKRRLRKVEKLFVGLKTEETCFNQFWKQTHTLDNLRKESFKDSFPELHQILSNHV